MEKQFRDRTEAGRLLAERLTKYVKRADVLVWALPRGGVPVAFEVARALDAPLDVLIVRKLGVPGQQELERREHLYRRDRPAFDVHGRTIILVDDGIATGATMHAAVAVLRKQQPARIVIAVPTSSPSTAEEFAAEVDEVVCVIKPEPFLAISYWYKHFSQTTDSEVCDLLAEFDRLFAAGSKGHMPAAEEGGKK